MADVPQIDIKAFIVCDDIRREDNGKEILIGVYSAGIVAPQFPVALALSFWMQFVASSAANLLEVEFRLMGGEDTQFWAIKAQVAVAKAGLGSLGIGQVPVMLQIPTVLQLQMKLPGQDWRPVGEISAEKGQLSFLRPPAHAQLSAPGQS
jgi:hypothetical protein